MNGPLQNVQKRCGVVVLSLSAWQQLINSDYSLILIPLFENLEGVGLAVKKGHHVLVPQDGTSGVGNSISVSRLRRDPAEKALVEMGLSDIQSRISATLVLQRRIRRRSL